MLLGVTPSPPAGTPSVVVKIADFGLSRGFVPEPAENAHTDWVSLTAAVVAWLGKHSADKRCPQPTAPFPLQLHIMPGLTLPLHPPSLASPAQVVTLYYRAPEMLLGSKSYGPGVDVWSAGCVLAELLNVSPMFKSDCEVGLLYDIFQKMGTPTPKTWPDLPAHANFSPEFPLWPGQPLEKVSTPWLQCKHRQGRCLKGLSAVGDGIALRCMASCVRCAPCCLVLFHSWCHGWQAMLPGRTS